MEHHLDPRPRVVRRPGRRRGQSSRRCWEAGLSIPEVIGLANVFICELTGLTVGRSRSPPRSSFSSPRSLGRSTGSHQSGSRSIPLLATNSALERSYRTLARAIGPNGEGQCRLPAWLQAFTSPKRDDRLRRPAGRILLWLLAAILIGLLLTRTSFGRHVVCNGSHPRAADLTRVNTDWGCGWGRSP